MVKQTNLVIYCPTNLQREAWATLLEKQPTITAVSTAATIPELQQQSTSSKATAVFVDAPNIDAAFVAQLITAVPNSGILLLINEFDTHEMVVLLQAGATGFIHQNAAVPDLARALIAVGRGEIVLPPDSASQVMLTLARGGGQSERLLDSLTDREKEMLALLAQGSTDKDIAQTLILSVRTVEAHLRNIYGKLQVASRTEATVWAVNHGFAPENKSRSISVIGI